jgi:Ser-tRNA(Ala) deacylase AlaX
MSQPKDRAMHTAEHVLNQTMVRLLGCGRAFSTHINPGKSKCDYHMDAPPTAEQAQAVEEGVNAVLARHLPVTEEFMSREEAGRLFDLARLPPDAGRTLRIVRVGDYDACPCIGEHVANTAEIGTFRLVSHSFENGVLRVRFRLA